MKYLAFAVLVIALPGCKYFGETYIPDPVFVQSPATTGGYITDGKVDLTKLTLANYEGAANQAARNSLIAQIMQLSDDKCELHKAIIMSNANAWNIGTSAASLLFTGVASVTSHAQTAAELAAAATATTGAQAVVNKELYAETLSSTIIRAIDEGRDINRATLERGLRDANYNVGTALIDLQKYHASCSLMSGLVEVTKALENRQPSHNEVARDIDVITEQITRISNNASLSQAQKDSIIQSLSRAWDTKAQQLSNAEE